LFLGKRVSVVSKAVETLAVASVDVMVAFASVLRAKDDKTGFCEGLGKRFDVSLKRIR
jgi:hypothetical protein